MGDRVLRELAGRLAAGLRRTDVVARYGGEEFAVLMAETSPEAARQRIEDLRHDIAALPVDLGEGQSLRLDFSAGVASLVLDGGDPTPTALVERADARLRAAKRAGRGRTLAAD